MSETFQAEGQKSDVGRVALVTGAARQRGIGRAIAIALAAAGADVAVHGSPRDPGSYPEHEREIGWRGAASVAAEIEAMGRRAIAVEADLTDPLAPAEIVRQTEAGLGTPEVLVNNAGTAGSCGAETIVELDERTWSQILTVNLDAVFRICKAAVPLMLENGGGSIVNISALAATKPRAMFGSYSASKAGLNALTAQMALEFAPTIRVNCVSPGSTETDMLDGTFARRDASAGAAPGT
jgi:NAD(P)-dependent dehydrogenase (short-subunit alcohol dehydrogenase family)